MNSILKLDRACNISFMTVTESVRCTCRSEPRPHCVSGTHPHHKVPWVYVSQTRVRAKRKWRGRESSRFTKAIQNVVSKGLLPSSSSDGIGSGNGK
jgi:hypothetical protein